MVGRSIDGRYSNMKYNNSTWKFLVAALNLLTGARGACMILFPLDYLYPTQGNKAYADRAILSDYHLLDCNSRALEAKFSWSKELAPRFRSLL